MVKNLKEGGTFLLNCAWSDEDLDRHLPASMKRALYAKKAKFYTITATAIARSIGLGNRTNTILQAAFFKLLGIIPVEEAVKAMKEAIYKTYFIKKGQAVVDKNYASIDHGINELHSVTIPENWKDAQDAPKQDKAPAFIKEVVNVMNRQEGEVLPVSTMTKYGLEDGTWPAGTTKYEKRGAAVEVPEWQTANCIQCNQCAFVRSSLMQRNWPLLLPVLQRRKPSVQPLLPTNIACRSLRLTARAAGAASMSAQPRKKLSS